jgi:DNA invertase Pin-like site-specific DNA recombinase
LQYQRTAQRITSPAKCRHLKADIRRLSLHEPRPLCSPRSVFATEPLLHLLERIEDAGAGFRSLTEAVDTAGPAGRMMMQMLGAFAEFERAMVRERTRAGLQAARSRGRKGGRRPKLSPEQKAEVLEMLASGRKTAADVARIFRVHRAIVSRVAAEARTVHPSVGDMRAATRTV